MKRLIYTFCILSLFACNNSKPESAQTYSPTPTGLQGIQSSNGGATAPASTQSNSNSGALNPAHGAPGHRCDIAVGAPLNSAPAQANAPTTQQVTTQQVTPQQTTTAAPQPTPTTSAVPTVNEKGQKLNPAHGMPGHKCEIQVGAPLN